MSLRRVRIHRQRNQLSYKGAHFAFCERIQSAYNVDLVSDNHVDIARLLNTLCLLRKSIVSKLSLHEHELRRILLQQRD